MLNNGTDQLDHLLSIGQSDRCGLGFKGESSKGGCVFVYAGATENVATCATKPVVKSSIGTATDGKAATVRRTDVKAAAATASGAAIATATRKTPEVQSEPRRAFVPVCHHCGVVGHIRPRCFKLLREKRHMEQTYGMKSHNPVCYY
ncbi:hypothetical protein YC2023_040346 [Brassica napus]